jgi:hypothetical protein
MNSAIYLSKEKIKGHENKDRMGSVGWSIGCDLTTGHKNNTIIKPGNKQRSNLKVYTSIG